MFLISGMAYAETPKNLVTNPGFENGTGWPTGWWGKLPTHCSSDNQIFHSGSKSLRVMVTDSKKYVLVGQRVPVTPGESYDIGAWIKTENATPPGAQICIEWSGPKGWLGGEWNAKKVTETQEWQFTGVERVQIPKEATSAIVYLRLIEGSTGTAWFDDVIVEKQVRPVMQPFILRPNYRGKVLPGAPSPEIKVEIILNPQEHGLTLDKLEMTAALKNKTGDRIVQENLKPLTSNSFNVDLDIPANTPPGNYHLTVDLYKAGNLLAQDTYPIEKLSQEDVSGLTSYIDGHNRFILSGKPFFPLGLYVVQYLSDTSQLDEIRNSPFDTLMNYNINSGTNAQITNYLNQLQSRNLKLIFSLVKDQGLMDINATTQKVTTFKNHPAIISWYMNDERGLEYLGELEALYQKVRELDKNHPVWSVNCRKYVLIGEAHTTDILGVDPYPIPGPITLVSQMADWAKDAGRGYRPLWLVPQIFDWSDYGRKARPPTREEMRAMTYLAVNHGARGLIYYSYFNVLDDADYQTRWEEIKEIAGEINHLRPVLLSTQQTNNNDIICNNRNIDFKLMREGDTYYLFAVNAKKETVTGVSFRNKLVNKPSTIGVLFENHRQLAAINGNFTDDFGPYGVHVYHWDESS